MRFHPIILVSVSSLIAGCSQPNSTAPHDSLFSFARSAVSPRGSPGARLDPHHGGRSAEMHVTGLLWGRLADVYALDGSSGEKIQVARDLVIGPDVRSDGRDYEVESHPITSITSVTVLHEIDSEAFELAWERLEEGLVPITDKSLDPAELPPYTKVPRDAAVVVRFDDLIDPATVNPDSLQVWIGIAHGVPSAPSERSAAERFPSRVLYDANHGGWTDPRGSEASRFYATRIILDLTTSEAEALASPMPAEVHPRGLPASQNPSFANAVLRIPTSPGTTARTAGIVKNLAGNGAAWRGNGSVDPDAATRDLVRAFVSGSDGDPDHGMLAPLQAPRVVGSQGVQVDAVVSDPQGGPHDYLAILTFATPACARAAAVRDVLVTPGAMAVVTRDSAPPHGAELGRLHVRLVAGGPPAAGPGEFRSPYDPVLDQGREACFVRFVPPPVTGPDQGVDPVAQIVLDFSQPMDPRSISPIDTWTVTSDPHPTLPQDYVAAEVQPGVQLDHFVFTPVLPLNHVAGRSEAYFVNLAAGPDGPRSLAGVPLRDALPQVRFRMDPQATSQETGSYVLRFQSADEDGNGHPEVRGQFRRDLGEGVLIPRPVARFSAVADRTQPVPGLMTQLPFGVQTPLVPLGSKLHSLWRYCDVGMPLLDETFTNVDVEGLAWSPLGGAVIADRYTRFEMSLAHAGPLPDEVVNPATLLPQYPHSGIGAVFAQNQLDAVHDPLRVVHPRVRGYTVDPAERFTSTTGTTMMPWPLNRNLPPSQHAFYTWRDTALQAKGAAGAGGAELSIVVQATGIGTPGVPYAAGEVPTIGLPLLMEFKCFPEAGAIGLNAMDVSIALNSSSLPNFRAFSSGGRNSSGQLVVVDPDLATVATGGFNPSSTPPGLSTLPIENTFYIGQMDLVVRVSRMHSLWIDTRSANASYAPPVVEPRPADQPAGTQIVLAFRGATAVSSALQADAGLLDPYGDASAPNAVTFFHGDNSWKDIPAALNGARLVQVRASFISNAATGLSPRMSGLGLAFHKP